MNFLDMLRNNPRGWGNGAGPEPEIAYQDDGGNLYGFNNALLQKAPAPQQGFGDQSLADMLIGIGSAPAKMATGLASGMSPYGSDGFQVPPLAGDAWEAINAPGTILNEGMTPEDRDRTATNAAGFMMGGGLVAPRIKGAASKLPMDEASRLTRAQEMGFDPSRDGMNGLLFSNGSKSGAGVGAGITRGAEAETSATAGHLANSLAPNQPQVPQTANGLQGQTPALSQGQLGQAPRSLIENDPYLKAWADHLGLDYDGLLSPSIAEAAANDAYGYYGLRATPYKTEVGQTPKNSTQWYQDFINEQQSRNMFPDHGEDLGGASSVGVEMTPEGINKARDLIANYWEPDGKNGDFVHLLGADRGWGGNDVGELVMRDSTVIGNAPRRSYGETLFSNGSKPGAAIGAGVVEGAKPIRAYRGSKTPEDVASAKDTYWATSNPETASDFAMMNEWPKQTHPNVSPVDVNFKNPLTINSNTPYDWLNVPYDGASRPWTNSVADKARELGHDGVIFKNIMEGTGDVPATTYAALQRGTVTSPLTGETIFSNGSKPGAAIGNSLVESQQGLTTEDILSMLGMR